MDATTAGRWSGGRRGPTCLYAPLRARPMPTPTPPPRTRTAPDPSQGRTDRDASSSSPAGPARPATTCSRCLAWRAAPTPCPRSRWALERRLCLCVRRRAVLPSLLRYLSDFRLAPSTLRCLCSLPLLLSLSRDSSCSLIVILPVTSNSMPALDLR
jgi:hypothetical protein